MLSRFRAAIPCRTMVRDLGQMNIPHSRRPAMPYPSSLPSNKGNVRHCSRSRHYLHTRTLRKSRPSRPVTSRHSIVLAHCFGTWNVFVAHLRRGLYGRVSRHGAHRAFRLARDALAVLHHGWTDLDTARWRQRASDNKQSRPDANGKSAHGFDDLHAYQHLGSRGYVFCRRPWSWWLWRRSVLGWLWDILVGRLRIRL